jgi:cytochrome oxidase Cu insertion factor (SCO1/SenC/PrrC family)
MARSPARSTPWRSALVVLAFAVPLAAAAQTPKPRPIWARNNPLPRGFNPGEAFPTIALPSAVDGKPTSLADFRGRKVIVNVFASW